MDVGVLVDIPVPFACFTAAAAQGFSVIGCLNLGPPSLEMSD